MNEIYTEVLQVPGGLLSEFLEHLIDVVPYGKGLVGYKMLIFTSSVKLQTFIVVNLQPYNSFVLFPLEKVVFVLCVVLVDFLIGNIDSSPTALNPDIYCFPVSPGRLSVDLAIHERIAKECPKVKLVFHAISIN